MFRFPSGTNAPLAVEEHWKRANEAQTRSSAGWLSLRNRFHCHPIGLARPSWWLRASFSVGELVREAKKFASELRRCVSTIGLCERRGRNSVRERASVRWQQTQLTAQSYTLTLAQARKHTPFGSRRDELTARRDAPKSAPRRAVC